MFIGGTLLALSLCIVSESVHRYGRHVNEPGAADYASDKPDKRQFKYQTIYTRNNFQQNAFQ